MQQVQLVRISLLRSLSYDTDAVCKILLAVALTLKTVSGPIRRRR